MLIGEFTLLDVINAIWPATVPVCLAGAVAVSSLVALASPRYPIASVISGFMLAAAVIKAC